ncbi:MAG: GGDEF domain-containing protein [Massilia sp.]
MTMDAATMVLALALGNLALCAALFFFDFGAGRGAVLSTWGLAKQLQAGAWLLLYLGATGVVPDPLALPAGYALLFAGVGFESGAAWEAADRTRWRRIMLPLLGVAIALFLAAWAVDDALRAIAWSLILGALYLSGAAALAARWRGAGMLQRFLALATGLLALLVAARGALVIAMPGGWGWLSNAALRQLSTTALYLLMVLNGFGCLLLARERLKQRLERLQVVDPLTNVANRRGFFSALEPWMALARRPGQPTALVLLDLDQFRRVNDSYGHPAGDAVLRHLVDVCRRQLRESDQLGRLVGVEFAILLPRTGLDEAALVAERMRAAIAATPVKTERAMITMTASFGITTIRPDDSTVTLFHRADVALQAAKRAGRNRVEHAAPALAPQD